MRKVQLACAALSLALLCRGAEAALTVKAIAAGGRRSLAVASDGTVWEWGLDFNPKFGGRFPTRVNGLSNIVSVVAANLYNLAVKEDGTVWAWGGGWSGGELMQYSAPVQLME